LNISASVASTRRSSAMYGSEISQLSSAGSEKQDPSPRVSSAVGKSVLANYCGSGESSGDTNMLIEDGSESRNQNLLLKKPATNEILDRAFFT